MTGVNLSVPRVVGDQPDKHHVIPQITLSARVITHTQTQIFWGARLNQIWITYI